MYERLLQTANRARRKGVVTVQDSCNFISCSDVWTETTRCDDRQAGSEKNKLLKMLVYCRGHQHGARGRQVARTDHVGRPRFVLTIA